MAILSIIVGVLLIIAGFSCIFTPLATFLSAGYFIAILLFAYGVLGIVRFAQKRATVIDLIISILAVVAGIAALFYPGGALSLDQIILYIIGAWLVLEGLASLFLAVKSRKINPLWGLELIIGVLGVAVGIYSFVHPGVAALTVGILIGIYFIQAGFNTIILGCAASTVYGE